MSLYSRLDRLAADVEKLNKQVTAVSNQPQSQRTSVEGGSIDFNDEDGNLMAVVGGQDDGSNTIRHVDGPTPPVPSGLSAHVDGPIVQVSWDGAFEDADNATYDWSHLEVIAVGPGNEQLTATINDVTGASTSVAATVSGEWTVVARSVSRAEKRSLDGDAGTVDVKLVDIDGAIEAVQDSANGKNKVTYSEHAPTESDPGIFDDTWFVGQVGRPNDVVEATNTLPNPSFENGLTGYIQNTSLSINTTTTDNPYVGTQAARVEARPAATAFTYIGTDLVPFSAGRWIGTSVRARADTPGVYARTRILFFTASGSTISQVYVSDIHALTGEWSQISGALLAPAGTAQVRTYLYLYSDASGTKPSAGQALVTDGWVVDDAGSEAEALARVVTYFDGNTESGTTDNESHYRWTGTPHASTSEKYLPALTIGDSDNWNVIEQYRHDGTSWVRVELSHYVFSSVDLGKATVGELDGIRIAAQTIRGQQLSGDAIDGKVITGATVQSAASGARAVMSASGFEAFDATNARTFFADATTGDVNMTGSFYSNYEGLPRVEIDNDDWADIEVVGEDGVPRFVNGSGIRLGSTAMDGASIFHGSWNTSGGASGQAATFEGPLGKSRLHLLDSGRLEIQSGPSAGTVNSRIGTFANGSAYVVSYKEGGGQSSRLSVDAFGRGTFSAYGGTNGVVPVGRLSVDEAFGAELTSQTTSGTHGARVRAGIDKNVTLDGESVNVNVNDAAGGRFRATAVYNVTSSAGDRVHVNAEGTLFRYLTSSSLRYKQNIVPAEGKPSILDVVPVTWSYKEEVERAEAAKQYLAEHGDGPLPREFDMAELEPPRLYGAIAEDVHELGLTELVKYDFAGRPDGLDYEKFGVALIPVVRELRDRVTELETKLENS